MFSLKQKRMISKKVEELLLEIEHPEMRESLVDFTLSVKGRDPWSFAEIRPNWTFNNVNRKG